MENYKPNSHKSKEQQEPVPEKKLEKVVHGKVTAKKKSEVSKLADIFIPGDVANVKSYVIMDVLITAVKKAITQLNGVEKVSARLNTKEVTVIYDEKVKIEDILKAIKTTSYEGVEISTKQSSN